jgi:hypothetical protein
VTEFVLRLYPQRRTVFSGFVILPANANLVEKVFTASDHWFKELKTVKSSAHITLVNPPPEKQVIECPLSSRSLIATTYRP